MPPARRSLGAMADAYLPDNLPAGTVIAAVTVVMSDGSTFIGALSAEPADLVTTAGMNLVLARALTPADGGADTWEVTATQDGYSATATLDVEIIPIPILVEFDPPTASLPDNAQAGTPIATVAVTMSDGSPFQGTLNASPAGVVRMEDDELVTARALTSADVGNQTFTVTTAP
jgi:hypothetical protein